MKNQKKLTVAISCYNFEKYIEQCIESILSQKTNFDFDIVIRDDFSKDGSREIIKSISEKYSNLRKIKYIFGDVNVGVNRNIQLLLSECEGEYISSIDGDDYITDEFKLQKQVDFLDNNKEYVLHCTSYKYIDVNGLITPHGNDWLCPLKEVVEIQDLLDQNYITFGRMFRNIPEIFENLKTAEYYHQSPYDDWALNFEILKFGKAKCDNWVSGIYRITGTGVLTSDSSEKLEEKNNLCRRLLSSEYNRITKDREIKPIAIIDSFVHNQIVEDKLNQCLDRLKEDGFDVLLISNTKIKNEILSKVNYFLHDDRNQLFSDEYTGVRDVDLWKSTDQFEAHEVKPGLQKHGLSVLINMFNSIEFAKSLGYTHFFRFEVDDEFGPQSREFIRNTKSLVSDSGKKALFYFNEGAYHNGVNDTEPYNVSFHFMYCEIDLFLDNIYKIKSEQDYKDYLMSTKGNLDFEIAEEFIYNNLLKIDQSLILKKSGIIDLKNDLPDTSWNLIVSESNTSEKFRGCTTLIYQVRKFPPGVSSILNPNQGERLNQLTIFTYNYKDQPKNRSIEVIFNDGRIENIEHNIGGNGSWAYHIFGDDIDKIKVHENGEFLYEDSAKKAKNYIIFK